MFESIDDLNRRFGAGENIRFEPGRGGLTKAVLRCAHATGEIYLHGAHVTQYQPQDGKPLLFVSDASVFEKDKPIRGGVPILLPWFGPRDGTDRTQMHGFVRTMPWGVKDVSNNADATAITLTTQSSDATRSIWPHDYEAAFTLSVGQTLKMSLTIRNTSAQPFTFEEGLHTYFAISDISEVKVQGLRGHWYRDRTVSEEWQLDNADAIIFPRRVDRLYRDARGTAVIVDPVAKREIIIAKEHSATTVVWNPHTLAPGEFSDLHDQDPKHFVCVESCNARENSYTLQPNESHTLTATIAARPLK